MVAEHRDIRRHRGHGPNSIGLIVTEPSTPNPTDLSFDKEHFLKGMVAGAPLAAPALPFGFVVGFLVGESANINNFTGWSSAWIVFAGSSQLAAVELLADSASALVIIFTVFLINSRHIMYSAAMNPRFAGAPQWFRILGSYLLIDQSFAIAESQPEDMALRDRMWSFLGTGLVFWAVWQTAVGLGVVLGNVIPEAWSLTFSVPILFVGLMVLAIRNTAGVIAAIVGGVVAYAARDFPQGLGLLLGIVLGVLAGAFTESKIGSKEPTGASS